MNESVPKLEDLRIKIFADGADKGSILGLAKKPYIKGFTTNPTLMRKAGVSDYEKFAKELLAEIKDKPISFEVFSDEFDEMEGQARKIASWAENVYVKIPITNTKGESSFDLVKRLASAGVKLNITAILTLEQVQHILPALQPGNQSIISVFAGRIANTGRDPIPIMKEAKRLVAQVVGAELLWASSREFLNIFHAEEAGCDIITVTPDLLKFVDWLGRDLGEVSLDTVQTFYTDAKSAGYHL
jgi:transaldolase